VEQPRARAAGRRAARAGLPGPEQESYRPEPVRPESDRPESYRPESDRPESSRP